MTAVGIPLRVDVLALIKRANRLDAARRNVD
jgi:hypothetical protein